MNEIIKKYWDMVHKELWENGCFGKISPSTLNSIVDLKTRKKFNITQEQLDSMVR